MLGAEEVAVKEVDSEKVIKNQKVTQANGQKSVL
jgi:hypothetical protein